MTESQTATPTTYRGYELRPGMVFGTVRIFARGEWVDTTDDAETAKAMIDDWMDAR